MRLASSNAATSAASVPRREVPCLATICAASRSAASANCTSLPSMLSASSPPSLEASFLRNRPREVSARERRRLSEERVRPGASADRAGTTGRRRRHGQRRTLPVKRISALRFDGPCPCSGRDPIGRGLRSSLQIAGALNARASRRTNAWLPEKWKIRSVKVVVKSGGLYSRQRRYLRFQWLR